jgi:hypothetical protein
MAAICVTGSAALAIWMRYKDSVSVDFLAHRIASLLHLYFHGRTLNLPGAHTHAHLVHARAHAHARTRFLLTRTHTHGYCVQVHFARCLVHRGSDADAQVTRTLDWWFGLSDVDRSISRMVVLAACVMRTRARAPEPHTHRTCTCLSLPHARTRRASSIRARIFFGIVAGFDQR